MSLISNIHLTHVIHPSTSTSGATAASNVMEASGVALESWKTMEGGQLWGFFSNLGKLD